MTVLCRYAAALVLAFYGFAKLTGAQFTVLSSELDKPLAEVSGFWLTWHYFSFSPVFGTLISLTQITLAVMLCWRRTTLLAACLGLGVMVTTTLIDLTYGIDGSGTAMALLTTACLAYVVAQHRTELLAVLWRNRPSDNLRSRRTALKATAQTAVLAMIATSTYWIANENNRAPTPLDGAWEVRSGDHRPPGQRTRLDRVYFEHNRAFLVIFRFGDRRTEHHFEVSPANRELRIWARWLTKDHILFTGHYELAGDTLRITGESTRPTTPLELTLSRLPHR